MLASYPHLGPLFSQTQMHIPDGYLSPLTSLVMFLLVLPFWVRAARVLRQRLSTRLVPLIALFAAFSFVIMMFNVPLPGGTTGHAVGGALAAIILGPEVATLAISIALVIQALFFGDGGILAIGANCFNMAVVLPYSSYAIYQLIAGRSPVDSARRPFGALVGGWVGLNLAAFFTAVEFGIQPLLFKAADGTPLYAPYPLEVAIPAMMIPHILVASVIEGLVTGAVVAYLQRANRPLLELNLQPEAAAQVAGFRPVRLLWVALAVLIVLTPLGLLAPGTAWGEWASEELTQIDPSLRAIPEGLKQLEGLWGAPLADYDVPALGNVNLGYVLSAVIGVFLTAVTVWLFTALLTGRRTGAMRKRV
jgi:cobalt/nickel transport system permease protein